MLQAWTIIRIVADQSPRFPDMKPLPYISSATASPPLRRALSSCQDTSASALGAVFPNTPSLILFSNGGVTGTKTFNRFLVLGFQKWYIPTGWHFVLHLKYFRFSTLSSSSPTMFGTILSTAVERLGDKNLGRILVRHHQLWY